MRTKYHIESYRFSLFLMVLAVSIIGVLLVGSAKSSVQDKQIFGLVVGVCIMIVLSLMNYSFILIFYRIMYIVNLLLLLMVQFVGESSKNAQRWLVIAGIQFQPSELCKIVLILFLAQYIMEHEDDLNTLKTILKIIALTTLPILLILNQPDLSTSIVIVLIFCVIMFASGLSYKIIGIVLAIGVPISGAALFITAKFGNRFLREYQYRRIMAWLNPSKYLQNEGWQQNNSIIAIGSGQLTGKGLNNNVIGSVKNGNFISEPQTDFIFAIAGEELGFVGCFVIIALLTMIVITCLMIGRQAKDLAGKIICCGMAALIGFQTFINISVATGIMPNTGLPLPFVSYGLTSLVTLFIGIGIVLNVGLQRSMHGQRGSWYER